MREPRPSSQISGTDGEPRREFIEGSEDTDVALAAEEIVEGTVNAHWNIILPCGKVPYQPQAGLRLG
jgi:hypothetical protein